MNRLPSKTPISLVLIAALWLNLSSFGVVLGQEALTETPATTDIPADAPSEDSPIEGDGLSPTEIVAPRTVDYFENGLIDITDQGVFDTYGNPIEVKDGVFDTSIVPSMGPKTSDSFEEYQKTLIESWGGKRDYTKQRLNAIQDSLNRELNRFDVLKRQIKEAEAKIEPIRAEVKNLEDQIKLFNDQISVTKEKIVNIELKIAERQLDMRDTLMEIKKSEIELGAQKQVVMDYIQLMYHQEEHVLDWGDGTSSTLKLLLADRSVSENLMGSEYLKVMEQTGRQVFYEVELKQGILKAQQETLQAEQDQLQLLYASLADEKRSLEEGRLAKKDLLESTKGEEAKYQDLLEESIRQQLESAIAIENLKDNDVSIEKKLKELEENLQNAEQGNLPGLTPETVQPETPSQPESAVPEISKSVFEWPVPPLAITTKFHDSSYPKKWGIHNAIDIRAGMQTPILAPANGYVVEAKDNGNGYSYIILAHKNNLITVYGHVYEILVKPGTVVKKGTVLGLSGGMPGTHGAGWQTTGPHLHFEVYKKGQPVDPLDYLPRDEIGAN
jgi:murein DD-endopeptidase MepM/ murein hydrolase activator NlpD